MEEPAFLITVHRVVGRIQIQHYLRRRSPLAVQKQIHQQRVDHPAIGDNLLVAITLRRLWLAQFQAVQRAGTGQGVTAVAFTHPFLAGHIGATTGQRQRAVVTQSVMVVQILIAGRQRQHPLCDQGLKAMLDPRWIAIVRKTGRQSTGHVKQPVSFTKQQYAAIRCQSTAVKRAHHRAPTETFKYELFCSTVCFHGVVPCGFVFVATIYR